MTLSASALSRAEQCVWWVKNVPDETEKVGDSATRGTLFHDHMEKCFEKMQRCRLTRVVRVVGSETS